MIRIATIEQIRAIEEAADASSYTYAEMMDNAGRAVADRAGIILNDIEKPRVLVLVGSGNNGGDGLVAGLYIAQDNADAEVLFYLLSEREDEYIETAREAELFIAVAEDDKDKRVLRNMVASADLVIDALYGIGVHLPIQAEAQKTLRNVNQGVNARHKAKPDKLIISPNETRQVTHALPIYVLAVDCPSGMNCDSGEIDSNIIPADETISFIAVKPGQLQYPGANIIGKLTIADIGISEKLDPVTTITDILVDSETVREKLPERGSNGHKGTYGRALIIAGSINYIGAPALAAEAAYRSGAGLVTVASPGNVIMALSGSLREVTWMMLAHDMGVVSENATSTVFKDIDKMKSLLIGPGLGTEKTTRNFLEQFLKSSSDSVKKPAKRKLGFGISSDNNTREEENNIALPPLVIDADGLNLLVEIDEWWTLLPNNTIITPHPGEMARLCNIETAEVQANRWQLAGEKAKEWGVVLVLKGAYTVIASPDGDFAVLPFAVDALATAGTGDILAGLIVGLLAQGISAIDSAIVGGYVHGLAGQILAQESNSRSVIAGDVLTKIGEAYQRIEA